jgi:hypothetical protein
VLKIAYSHVAATTRIYYSMRRVHMCGLVCRHRVNVAVGAAGNLDVAGPGATAAVQFSRTSTRTHEIASLHFCAATPLRVQVHQERRVEFGGMA